MFDFQKWKTYTYSRTEGVYVNIAAKKIYIYTLTRLDGIPHFEKKKKKNLDHQNYFAATATVVCIRCCRYRSWSYHYRPTDFLQDFKAHGSNIHCSQVN